MSKQTKWGLPALLLRAEGTAVLAAAAFIYAQLGFSWLTFALLLLWPDLTFILYAANKQMGTVAYNLVHTYVFPIALAVIAIVSGWQPGIQFALIWFAHIGMDRVFGYGLKYSDDFKNTHLNRV
jgi:hypothetical protein